MKSIYMRASIMGTDAGNSKLCFLPTHLQQMLFPKMEKFPRILQRRGEITQKHASQLNQQEGNERKRNQPN